MKLFNEIRETLTDPLLRAGYDERLRSRRCNGSAPLAATRDCGRQLRPRAAPGALGGPRAGGVPVRRASRRERRASRCIASSAWRSS